MLHTKSGTVAIVLASAIALAGCNNSTSPSPNPTPSVSNISGDYTGTIQSTQLGSASAAGTLAQHGADAGGSIAMTQGTTTVTAQIAVSVNSSNAVSGGIVIDYPNGTTCTYTTTGTYANNGSTSATLSGSFKAVTNCSGDTGTYTLTQQCTDTVTSGDRRVMGFPAAC